MTELVSRRQALACAGATLLAYVGVIHEVVGATLYPDGPLFFGGTVGWHAAGLGLLATGVALAAATLGVVRLPVVALALALGAAGAVAVAGEAWVHGGFHLFAFTMVVAGLGVALAAREVPHV